MKEREKLKETLEEIHKLAEESILYLPKLESLGHEEKEPLIKDEKIRKAVRAWSEAIDENDNLIVSYSMEYHECCIYVGNLGSTALIDFNKKLGIEEGSYTITELCGEEE